MSKYYRLRLFPTAANHTHDELRSVKRFWLVRYSQRHATTDAARVRLFFTAADAEQFRAELRWSDDWRFIEQLEMLRTGLGFKPVCPF